MQKCARAARAGHTADGRLEKGLNYLVKMHGEFLSCTIWREDGVKPGLVEAPIMARCLGLEHYKVADKTRSGTPYQVILEVAAPVGEMLPVAATYSPANDPSIDPVSLKVWIELHLKIWNQPFPAGLEFMCWVLERPVRTLGWHPWSTVKSWVTQSEGLALLEVIDVKLEEWRVLKEPVWAEERRSFWEAISHVSPSIEARDPKGMNRVEITKRKRSRRV